MANFENVPTPWGRSQSGSMLAPGITQYHTAGHGGVKVIKKLNQQIPTGLRAADGWYEEDCDMCIPIYVHFDAIKAYMTETGMPSYRLSPEEYFSKFDRAYFKGRIEEYYVAETIHHFGTVHPPERLERHGMETIKARIEQIKRKERTPLPFSGEIVIFDRSMTFGNSGTHYARFRYEGRNVFTALHAEMGEMFKCRIRHWQARDYRLEKV